jgi:hypothetical protein
MIENSQVTSKSSKFTDPTHNLCKPWPILLYSYVSNVSKAIISREENQIYLVESSKSTEPTYDLLNLPRNNEFGYKFIV